MFVKLVRIGKDAELKQSQLASHFCLSVVYDIGFGENKQSQWMSILSCLGSKLKNSPNI